MALKYLLILTFSGLLFFTSTIPVWAHEVSSESTIGATMHLDPNDAPIANQPATAEFFVKDIDNKFDFKACTCSVTVMLGEKEVSKVLITSQFIKSKTQVKVPITFPQAGRFTIELGAKPTQNSTFKAFATKFNTTATTNTKATANPAGQVAPTSVASAQSAQPAPLVSALAGVGLLLLAVAATFAGVIFFKSHRNQ